MEGPRLKDDFDPTKATGPQRAPDQQPKKSTNILKSAYTWLSSKLGGVSQAVNMTNQADRVDQVYKDAKVTSRSPTATRDEKLIAKGMAVFGEGLAKMKEEIQNESPNLAAEYSQAQKSFIDMGNELKEFAGNKMPKETINEHLDQTSGSFYKLENEVTSAIIGRIQNNLGFSQGSPEIAKADYEVYQDIRGVEGSLQNLQDRLESLKEKLTKEQFLDATESLVSMQTEFVDKLSHFDRTIKEGFFDDDEMTDYCNSLKEDLVKLTADIDRLETGLTNLENPAKKGVKEPPKSRPGQRPPGEQGRYW